MIEARLVPWIDRVLWSASGVLLLAALLAAPHRKREAIASIAPTLAAPVAPSTQAPPTRQYGGGDGLTYEPMIRVDTLPQLPLDADRRADVNGRAPWEHATFVQLGSETWLFAEVGSTWWRFHLAAVGAPGALCFWGKPHCTVFETGTLTHPEVYLEDPRFDDGRLYALVQVFQKARPTIGPGSPVNEEGTASGLKCIVDRSGVPACAREPVECRIRDCEPIEGWGPM